MFLTQSDLETLTGRKQKAQQIAQLRKMGIRFFVNASGHPVVPVAAVEGRKPSATEKPAWSPKWAGALPQT